MGRFGVLSWAKKRLKLFILRGFVEHIFFEDKTVRRRFRDQLGPKKAPKCPQHEPKRGPRSTPKRPKIDIKIDMNFDANPRGAQPLLGRRHWAETPPRGAPGTRPREPTEAAQAPRDRPPRPPGTHVRVLNT